MATIFKLSSQEEVKSQLFSLNTDFDIYKIAFEKYTAARQNEINSVKKSLQDINKMLCDFEVYLSVQDPNSNMSSISQEDANSKLENTTVVIKNVQILEEIKEEVKEIFDQSQGKADTSLDQYQQKQENYVEVPNYTLDFEQRKEIKEILFSKIKQNEVNINKIILTQFGIPKSSTAGEYRIFQGKEVLYLSNSSQNIDVLQVTNDESKVLKTIDIQHQGVRSCVEVQERYFICSCYDSKVYKFDLWNYSVAKVVQYEWPINHILYIKENILLLASVDGAVFLFDYEKFKCISSFYFQQQRNFTQMVKCFEDENKVVLLGSNDMFLIEVSGDKLKVEKIADFNEFFSQMLQLSENEYLLFPTSSSANLIQSFSLEDKTLTTIIGPQKKRVNVVKRVQNLEDVAVIVCNSEIYLFDCQTTMELTYLMNCRSDLQSELECSFDETNKCLNIKTLGGISQQSLVNVLDISVEF